MSDTAKREDEVLLRMLKTPPKPHAPLKAKKTASRPKRDSKKAKARAKQ